MFTFLSLSGLCAAAVGAWASAQKTPIAPNASKNLHGNGFERPLAFNQQARQSHEQQMYGREKRIREPRLSGNNGKSGKKKAIGFGRENGPVVEPGYLSNHDWNVMEHQKKNALVQPLGYIGTAWRNPYPQEARVARSLPHVQPGITVLQTPLDRGSPMSPYVRDPAVLGEFGQPQQISSSGFISLNGVHNFFERPGKPSTGHFSKDHTPRPLPAVSTYKLIREKQAARKALVTESQGVGALLPNRIAVQPNTEYQMAKNMIGEKEEVSAYALEFLVPKPTMVRTPYQ